MLSREMGRRIIRNQPTSKEKSLITEKNRLLFLVLLLSIYYSWEMEAEKSISAVVKKPSPCDVEALKKCLEENKGDYIKCQSQIEAFKSSCSLKKPSPVSDSSVESRWRRGMGCKRKEKKIFFTMFSSLSIIRWCFGRRFVRFRIFFQFRAQRNSVWTGIFLFWILKEGVCSSASISEILLRISLYKQQYYVFL